jgi:endogenous inhibitor of DNA gyrase (YacG/DUF329 family)
MRHFYKSHGRHCYLRSFQTKCPKCGKEVLYWECTHGSKVFFEYPPYGKLIRHICQKSSGKYGKKVNYEILIKIPKGLLEKRSPNCPVCGKLFKSEKDLNNHLQALRKEENLHKQFFENKLIFENTHSEDIKKENRHNIFYNKPRFGRINIKKRN